MSTIIGIYKAAERTARILNNPAFQSALEFRQHAPDTTPVLAASTHLNAWTSGMNAFGRTWMSELDRLLDSMPYSDLHTLASITANSPAVTVLKAPFWVTTRREFLTLYDALSAQRFEHPMLTRANIELARNVIASAPETIRAALPDVKLSGEEEEQVGALVEGMAAEATGPDRQERAQNLGNMVAVLFLTAALLGDLFLSGLVQKGLEVSDLVLYALLIRKLAIRKYLESHNDES